MTKRPASLLIGACLCLLACSQALAQPAALAAAVAEEDELSFQAREARERATIKSTREAVQTRAATLEAGCYRRFFVNDCLADVRAERRERLSDLRRQETLLNDAARKRRAAAQLLRLDERAGQQPATR